MFIKRGGGGGGGEIRDKTRGMLSILYRFRNEFNIFNNTGVRMLDYIYHMTLMTFKYLKI